MTTPCTWMPAFTQKSEWIGGFTNEKGEKIRTLDGLKSELSPDFELLHVEDFPLLIREHSRKFQYIVSQMSIWKRKEN